MGKNKTIYFRNHIYDRLLKVDEPGPLINDLLEAHFNSTPAPTTSTIVDTRERGRVAGINKDGDVMSMQGDIDTIVDGPQDASSKNVGKVIPFDGPVGGPGYQEAVKKITAEQPSAVGNEKPCCKKSAPCQHWQWDGVAEVWKNSLSGRTRSND